MEAEPTCNVMSKDVRLFFSWFFELVPIRISYTVLDYNPDGRLARLEGQLYFDKMLTLQAGSSVPLIHLTFGHRVKPWIKDKVSETMS